MGSLEKALKRAEREVLRQPKTVTVDVFDNWTRKQGQEARRGVIDFMARHGYELSNTTRDRGVSTMIFERSQPPNPTSGHLPPPTSTPAQVPFSAETWSAQDLESHLERYCRALTQAGHEPEVVANVRIEVDHFVRWLDRRYDPSSESG